MKQHPIAFGKALLKQIACKLALLLGYRLTKPGLGYIVARPTIRAARKKGVSICQHLEDRENDARKRGKRDRIIQKLKEAGTFQECRSVCEIGAGTGMYLEKVLELAQPSRYEVYETASDWVRYLKRTHSGNAACQFLFHRADGHTLKETKSGTCDLVHAHGVFVYLPLFSTLDYIAEAIRICRPGGRIVFDCLLDSSFDLETVKAWQMSQWRFPVIIPDALFRNWLAAHDLRIVSEFSEIFGASIQNYFILQKKPDKPQ